MTLLHCSWRSWRLPWGSVSRRLCNLQNGSVARQRTWLALGIGLALSVATLEAMARPVTDMLGRTVEVPERIDRVIGAAPPVTALLYALAPEHVVGLNMPFLPGDERFVGAWLPALPVVGGILGHGRRMQPEAILELRPDIALSWAGAAVPAASIDETIRFFEQVGVPVLFVRLDTLTDWPAAFEFVGRLLGRQPRAAELGIVITDALTRVGQAVADVPQAERKRVYYAEGVDGLATECHGSFHVEPIDLAGGYNVHRCTPSSYVGMEKVSLEQVLAYDPEVILVQDAGFLSRLDEHGPWRRVRAVRDGQVLRVPQSPLNWLDRPPSFMRALGIQWLAHALYPERFPFEVQSATRDFYARFFGVALDNADLERLLDATASPGPSHQHHH